MLPWTVNGWHNVYPPVCTSNINFLCRELYKRWYVQAKRFPQYCFMYTSECNVCTHARNLESTGINHRNIINWVLMSKKYCCYTGGGGERFPLTFEVGEGEGRLCICQPTFSTLWGCAPRGSSDGPFALSKGLSGNQMIFFFRFIMISYSTAY